MSRGPLKAWFFLFCLSLFLTVAGYILLDRQGLIIGVGLALGINTLVFFYGDLRTLNLFGGERVLGQDPWNLLPLVKKLSAQMKLPPPEVYIVEHDTPQAFSVGRSWKSAKICLTRGLLKVFNAEEIEAVVAVELTRIERLDTFSFQVANAFSDGILMSAQFLDRVIGFVVGAGGGNRRPRVFTKMAYPFAALAVRLIVGPRNYLQADQEAANQIKNARGLAVVLWKLESYAATFPMEISPSMAHLFIVNPLTASKKPQYFRVQPSIQRRIEHLLGYYPL